MTGQYKVMFKVTAARYQEIVQKADAAGEALLRGLDQVADQHHGEPIEVVLAAMQLNAELAPLALSHD